VRVGTLDEPARFPPQAHIYVRSKQPWLKLPPEVATFQGGYNAARIWPALSLERYEAAKAAKAATKKRPGSRAT
jgi:hypothetical protein